MGLENPLFRSMITQRYISGGPGSPPEINAENMREFSGKCKHYAESINGLAKYLRDGKPATSPEKYQLPLVYPNPEPQG
jgi:hypothetical protein